ncbi:MAG: response regulator [Rhodopirellula sp.]|nr:response regulator [Rhodopirellula sp.]
MEPVLRILHLEDDWEDSEWVHELLREGGLAVELERVETLADFQEALQRESYALIISDYTLPGMDPLETMHLARQLRPEVPFVFVSGTLGEDLAIEMLKRGASDYVLKQRISRLVPAVRRALQEAQEQSRRKQAEEELAQARAAADAANLAKSRFLASMSHELRTPLNSILGMTDLALREALSPKVEDYLKSARESAEILLELLDEVLDFSRIEAGGVQLESIPFSPLSILEGTVKALGLRACEKGLELMCDLPDDLPEQVIGDPLRLRQILTNLLSNAIKFTAQGEIVLRVRVESREARAEECLKARIENPGRGNSEEYAAAPDALNLMPSPLRDFPVPESRGLTADFVVLKFSVSDTGIGIAREDQQRIFASFTQADASTTRCYGGTGLGLAISSRLAAMMDGRIEVESELGRGSTFHFTSTLALPSATESGSAQPPAGLETLRDLRILLVNSNATSRQIQQRMLVRWGMKPEAAEGAPAALAAMDRAAAVGEPFRLLLVDGTQPEIDGFTLAEHVQSLENLTPAIVLMLSPSNQGRLCRCGETAKKAVYLDKPVTQSGLLRAIMEAVGINSGADKSAPVSIDGSWRERARRSLRILLAEDNPANQKVAMFVLNQRGHAVEVVQNGSEAVDMVRQRDFDVVLMDVHMPVMDGFQATSAIRALQDPRKAKVPIVAITAHALKGDQQRCLSAGMDGYLAKPIDARELIELVDLIADKDPLPQPLDDRQRTEEADCEKAAEPAGEDVFNSEVALASCFGSHAMFVKMAEFFLAESTEVLNQLDAAVRGGNATALAAAAHRLRGTIVYLGARSAADAAQQVEQLGKSGDLTGAAEKVRELSRQVAFLKEAMASLPEK